MIDIHTHVFNLAYLPVHGILRARGVPESFAAPAARVLDRLTRVDEMNVSEFDTVLSGAMRSELEVTITDLELDIARSVSDDDLAAVREDLAQASVALDAMSMPAANDEISPSLLLDLDLLGTDRERLVRMLRAVGRLIDGGDEMLRWLVLMLNRETAIVERLLSTWPEVSLFAHHMMDMDHHYPPGASRFDFVTEQLVRMRKLVARYPGRFLTFVAFDPFRADAVDVVRLALDEHGCGGVKFYPPNGYKPIGNRDEDLIGARADDVNRRNLELFRLCVERDVPLFTHCTPGGMESRPKVTGKFSDPKRWRRVLETDGLSTLRLCLGHAGGDEGWVAPHSAEGDAVWARSYACEVVALCARYPNVYCEFGHMDCVLRTDERAKLARRLERVVEQYGDAFGLKMMYGSDWHLVARVPDHGELVRVWRAVMRGSGVLAGYETKFLRANAHAYIPRASSAPSDASPGGSTQQSETSSSSAIAR